MESYDKFKGIKLRKVKSPKVNRSNPLIKDYNKELVKDVPKHPKKIKILSKRKKKETKSFIPTELNIKSIANPKPDPKPDPDPKPEPIPVPIKEPVKKKKSMKRARRPVKDNKYKSKTISVKLKKNKENDINNIIKKFDEMDIKDIQSKLKSKGIHSKNKNKNKLLKYMYLITCVDDNINIIKN